MATESADGTEMSVTLPPDLEEWLEDRAAELGVDREELLVQLASTYRATAEHDTDLLDGLAGDGVDAEALEAVESRLSADEENIAALGDRIDAVESDLETNVEDLRTRVLQLRDAVADSAPENHSHGEFSRLESSVDDLAADLEAFASDLEARGDRVDDVASRLEDAEKKLTRVARAVVALRREVGGEADADTLEELRMTANRNGVAEADCGACETPVTVGLLTEPACPHCGTGFAELELPAAGLGRALGFRQPRLRCRDPPALEAGDE
jgi:predicted  nucleic acid-binding Zn-ribbon protein